MRLGFPLRGWIIAGALGVGLAGHAGAASLSVFVTGDVGSPRVFDASALRGLPQVTQTDTYRAAGRPVTDTFTGPTLWSVLQASGGITTDASVKNGLLRTYVIATGADGYKAVISTGEIAARFGNKPDLVAISDSAAHLPNPDGVARLTAPGDVNGGRYVSQLASLQVATTPTQPGGPGGRTDSLNVDGHVSTPKTDTLASLQALTPHTETVTYQSGPTSVSDTYTGALLWDVLQQAGIITDASIKNDILRDLVTATGSDGYQVTFSLGELSPSFGNEPILVAYSDTGGQLAGGDGFARLVVPGDTAGGRYVSNLTSLSVFNIDQVPLPSSAPLFGMALLAVGVVSTRVNRKRARSATATPRSRLDRPVTHPASDAPRR